MKNIANKTNDMLFLRTVLNTDYKSATKQKRKGIIRKSLFFV